MQLWSSRINLQLSPPRGISMPSSNESTPQLDSTDPTLGASVTSPSAPQKDSPTGSAKVVQTPEGLTPRPEPRQWNSISYFTPKDNAVVPDSPSKAAAGARSPQELLRRLSLVDNESSERLSADPRAAYPTLQLSGRIISATFCIPYSLGFESGQDWVSITATSRNPY